MEYIKQRIAIILLLCFVKPRISAFSDGEIIAAGYGKEYVPQFDYSAYTYQIPWKYYDIIMKRGYVDRY